MIRAGGTRLVGTSWWCPTQPHVFPTSTTVEEHIGVTLPVTPFTVLHVLHGPSRSKFGTKNTMQPDLSYPYYGNSRDRFILSKGRRHLISIHGHLARTNPYHCNPHAHGTSRASPFPTIPSFDRNSSHPLLLILLVKMQQHAQHRDQLHLMLLILLL